MRGPSEILGQECAELLGLVSQEMEFLQKVANANKKKIASHKNYTVSPIRVTTFALPG